MSDDIKNRLASLRSQILSDSTDFNTDDHILNTDDLPDADFEDIEPPIDYEEKKKEFKKLAEEEILSIIGVYITDLDLLKTARLISKTNNYIRKYTSLLDILDKYENNLITIQESIDLGDKSKEQFELVNKTGAEISKRHDDIDKLLNDCENFFESYNERFGFRSVEEELISKTKDESDEDNIKIISMADLAETIQSQMNIMEKEKKDSKK